MFLGKLTLMMRCAVYELTMAHVHRFKMRSTDVEVWLLKAYFVLIIHTYSDIKSSMQGLTLTLIIHTLY